MAKPFFSGNYGSALARVDTRPIVEAGKAQGQMYANMGKQIGGMIKEYGLNKEKQGKLTDKIENRLKLDPSIAQRLTMSGDEDYDKTNITDMEKLTKGELGLKGLQRLDSAMATLKEVDLQKNAEEEREMRIKQSLVNQKLLEQDLNNKNELQTLRKQGEDRKDKAYISLTSRAEELRKMVSDGVIEYDNLNSISKRIYNDIDLFRNKQVDPDKYAFSTEEEAQAELDKLEAEKLTGEIEQQNIDIAEKTEEAARMPEFNDRASAVESVKDLPQGVSASFKKFKDGFDVELQYKAKDFTDIPSVPGFPNYKIVGGYVYEGDPKTKKLTKLGSENFGEKSELIQKTIEALTTKDVSQYSLAKFRGVQNDDGDYEFENPSTGETITIPFNQHLEDRLSYLGSLEKQLKSQVDLDLTKP